MKNCSFDINKDLLRVHQILFDSLLEGNSIEDAVKDLRKKRYLTPYKEQLRGSIEESQIFFDYLSDVVERALDIFEEFAEEVDGFSEFKNQRSKYSFNNQSTSLLKDYINQDYLKSLTEEDLAQDDFPAELESISNSVDLDTEQLNYIARSVNDSINLDLTNVRVANSKDVKELYYPNAEVAYTNFLSDTRGVIMRDIVINSSLDGSMTVESYNAKIQNLKNDFLNTLTGETDVNYYGDNYSSNRITNILKEAQDQFMSANNGKGLDIRTLRAWSLAKPGTSTYNTLQKYNAFVVLKHFDDVIGDLSGNLIQVLGHKNIETDTNKYAPTLDDKFRNNWRDSEIDLSALEQASEFYKIFVENMRLVRVKDGKASSDKSLDVLKLNNSIAKIVSNIDLSNPDVSLKDSIFKKLDNYFKNGDPTLFASDIAHLLTLYVNLFAEENLDIDPLLQSKYFSQEFRDNLKSNYPDGSLYSKFQDFVPRGNAINLYESVISDILKIDLAHYGEVSLNIGENRLEYKTFLNKESDKQFHVIKNITSFNSLHNKVTYQRFSERGRFEVEGTKVHFNYGDGFTYDVVSGDFTDGNGSIINTKDLGNYINSPNYNDSVSDIIEDGRRDEYKDYFNLVDTFDSYLSQPLGSENYALLEMFKEMTDTIEEPHHLKGMLQILSNVAFTNVLNNTDGSLNSRINEIANTESLVYNGLRSLNVEGLSVNDVWDNNARRFRIELSEDAGAALGAIKDYARVLNNYFNTSARAVVMNTEGNAVPTYILATLANRIDQTISKTRIDRIIPTTIQGRTVRLTSPLADNLYVSNEDLISRIEINSGARGSEGNTTSSGNMSMPELYSNSIKGNFLNSLIDENGETTYQPANFSDKGKHISVVINRNNTLTLTINGERITSKLNGEGSFTVDQIRDAYLESMDTYYYRSGLLIVSDFIKAFEHAPNLGLGKAYFENSKYLQELLDIEDVSNFTPEDFKNLKDTYSDQDYFIKELNGLERAINVRDKIADLNKAFSKASGRITPESRSALIKVVNELNNIVEDYNETILAETLALADVDVLKTYHFDKDPEKGNKIQLHKALLIRLEQYSPENIQNTIKNIERDFAESLSPVINEKGERTDVLKLDTKDKFGRLDSSIKNYLNNMSEEDRSVFQAHPSFIDSDKARLRNFIETPSGEIILNPILKRYLWENNLFGRSFHLLSMGSELGHPAKKEGKSKEQRTSKEVLAALFKAQNKRNIMYNASFTSLYSNSISTLPGRTKTITIDDYFESVAIPYGLNGGVEPTDGSAIINPLHLRAVNSSLYAKGSMNSLKTIQGVMDTDGRAKVLKYAEFPAINRNVRDGYRDDRPNFYLHALQRTMSEDFTQFYGTDLEVDITKNFLGENHDIISRLNPKFIYNDKLASDYNFNNDNDSIKDGDLVEVKEIRNVGPNHYVFKYDVTNSRGDTTPIERDYEITNLFQLFTALGGSYSVQYDQNELDKFAPYRGTPRNGYVYSDSSMDTVYEFLNTVGTKVFNDQGELLHDKNTITSYYKNDLDKPLPRGADLTVFNTPRLTQFNVIQPLKTSLIGRISFTSGKKVGASNIVSIDDFMNPNKNVKYDNHSNEYYGLQMSAEGAIAQEGIDDEVTEQGQIITALDFVGHTPENALRTYNGISNYIVGILGDFNSNVFNMSNDPTAKRKLDTLVRDIVARSLESRDITGVAGAVVATLREELNNNLEPEFQIPFSSPDVYNTVFNAIGNYITKKAIRRKFRGLGAVLKPNLNSVRTVRITNDDGTVRTEVMQEGEYAEYLKNNEPEILEYVDNLDYNVDMFTTVTEKSTGTIYYLDNPGKYLRVKLKMQQNPSDWTIDVNASRTLKPNVSTWIGADGTLRNNYDMPLAQLANMTHSVSSINKEIEETIVKRNLAVLKGESVEMIDLKITDLETDLLAINNEYGRLLSLTGINGVIDQVNSPDLNIEFENLGTTPVVENGQLKVTEKEAVNKVELFPDTLTKDFKLSEEQTNLIKVLLSKEYKMLDAGYAKLDLFDVNSIINSRLTEEQWNRIVYDENGNELGTLGEYVNNLANSGINIDNIGHLGLYLEAGDFKTESGEVLAPMIYRAQFGLSVNATNSSTTPADFLNNLNNKFLSQTEDYDMYIPKSNGSHLYIVFKNGDQHKDLLRKGLLNNSINNVQTEVDEITGKIYTINAYGKRISQVPTREIHNVPSNGRPLTYLVIDPSTTTVEDLRVLNKKNKGHRKIIPQLNNIDNYKLYSKYVDGGALRILNSFTDIFRKGNNTERAISNFELEYQYLNDLESYTLDEVNAQIVSAEDSPLNLESKLNTLRELRDALVQAEINPELDNKETIRSLTRDLADRRSVNVMNKIEHLKLRAKDNVKSVLSTDKLNSLVTTLKSYFYEDVLRENEELANKQYASFRATRHISNARIPGQHLQSWMAQKIVGYTDEENNIAYVSNTHMLITGEDFDIDKGYLSYYSLNSNGILPGWSSYWKDSSEEELLTSLMLPIPYKLEIDNQVKTVNSINALSTVELEALANGRDTSDIEQFKTVVKALNKISASATRLNKDDNSLATIYVRGGVDTTNTEMINRALEFVNYYFNDTIIDPTDNDYEMAYTNAIVSGIINTGSDIRNLNEQLSPMSFGEYENQRDTSIKGKMLNNLSYENPLDIFKAQNSAMVGKDVIAIVASGGLKPFGMLAHNTTKLKSRGVGVDLKLGVFSNVLDDMLGAISLDDPIEIENMANHLVNKILNTEGSTDTLRNLRNTLLENVKYILTKKNLTRVDRALEISALLAAATDNAKELILGAINAGPETVGYYIAASVVGVDAKTIADMMNSPTVENMLRYIERDVFIGKSMKFDRLLESMDPDNIISPRNYINLSSAYSIFNHLKTKTVSDKNIIEFLYEREDKEKLKERSISDLKSYEESVEKRPYYFLSRLFSPKNLNDPDLDLRTDIISELGSVTEVPVPKGVTDGSSIGTRLIRSDNMSEYESQMMDENLSQEFGDYGMDDFNMDSEFMQDMMDELQSEFLTDLEGEFSDDMRAAFIPTIDAKVMLHRYFEEVLPLYEGIDWDIIRDLTKLMPIKKAMEDLGKMAGVNQGLKNNFFDAYTYLDLFYKYVVENVRLEEGEDSGQTVLNNYQAGRGTEDLSDITNILNMYFEDSEFRSFLDDRLSHSPINLLNVVYNTPHMQSMVQVANSTMRWQYGIQFKSRVMNHILKTTRNNVPLSRDLQISLDQYANEIVITSTLKKLKEQNPNFTTVKGIEDGVVTEADITTVKGRIAFTNWFENDVLLNLRDGVLLDPEGNPTEVRQDLKNNDLLKAITSDSRVDNTNKHRYNYMTIRLNTTKLSSSVDIMRAEQLENGMVQLDGLDYHGHNLTDLFFLYNLIIFKDRNTNGSFSTVLRAVSNNYKGDNIMSQYMHMLGWLDSQSNYSGELEFEPNELYKKGYAITTYSKPFGTMANERVYKMYGRDGNPDTIFIPAVDYKDGEEVRIYEEIQSTVPNKYISIDNTDFTVDASYNDTILQNRKRQALLANMKDFITINIKTTNSDDC